MRNKWILSAVLCALMALGLPFVAARASTYSVDVRQGDVVFTIASDGSFSIRVDGMILHPHCLLNDDKVDLTGTTNNNNIVVLGGGYDSLPLLKLKLISGLSVQVTNKNALKLLDKANVELTLDGTSTLQTTSEADAAVNVPPGSSLTITGTGTLNATVLAEAGDSPSNGAAIGGNFSQGCGSVTVAGGTVNAETGAFGSMCAGAGVGGGSDGDGGTVTVSDGVLNAYAIEGAGVGGGNGNGGGNGGTVVMSGGELRATGASGAAIGGGLGGSGTQGAQATVDLGTFAYEWSRTSKDSVYQPKAAAAFANNNNAGFAGIRTAGTYTLSTTPNGVMLPARTEGYDINAHPSSADVTITNTGDRKILITSTGASTDRQAVSITPTELTPGATATLTITAKNTCVVGGNNNAGIITVSDSNGASVLVLVSFTINPALAITSFEGKSIVQGETATLEAIVTGGTGDKSYEWSWTDSTGPQTTTTTVNTLEVTPDATTTYTLTVTDAGFGTATDSAIVTVTPQDHSISLVPSGDQIFATQTVGYAQADLTALDATVSNTGNVATGDLSVALSGADSDSFTLSKTSLPSIAKGGPDASFTVVPKTGLAPVGDAASKTFTATVTVSRQGLTSKSFNVSFTVRRQNLNPSTDENSITGIVAGQKYPKGPALTFTAHGGGWDDDDANDLDGDLRWEARGWSVNPSGIFATGMTQSFETATMTLGAHMLTVNFVQQRCVDRGIWADATLTDTKTVSFVLVKPAVPPQTGDDAKLWLWIGLGALCAAGIAAIVVAGVKRRKR